MATATRQARKPDQPAAVEVRLPALHRRQQAVHDSPARFRVLVCGRRWGKTMLVLACALEQALQGKRVWYVAPAYPMARVAWRELERWGGQLAAKGLCVVRKTDHALSFTGGGEIVCRSADNRDSLRGDGLDLVVVDEAALVDERAWTECLRPALSDRRGRALIISTPRGQNWLSVYYQRGQDGSEPDVESWCFPSYTNPFLDPEEIKSARLDMPDRVFRQEYGAEFIADGAVFRGVRECIGQAERTGGVVFGVDWGRSDDFTVAVAMDRETGAVLAMDRMRQVDYVVQVGRLNSLARQWEPECILAESNAMGEPLVEQLRAEALPVQGFATTSASKPRIIDALALAFEQRAITIPNDPVLLAELAAYTMERSTSGRWTYSAPSGMHDDCVMALALAWEARSRPGFSVEMF